MEFSYIFKKNVQTKEPLKNFNPTFDSMSIRKQLINETHNWKYVGYSDLGMGGNVHAKGE